MNDIYKNYWNPIQNFFLPSFKIKEKYRIGAKIIKKYDKPKTPYQRLMDSAYLTEEQKERLKQTKDQLNPFTLHEGLEVKLSLFFKLLKQSKTKKDLA